MHKRFTSRFTRIGALAAAVTVMALGSSAAPASAAIGPVYGGLNVSITNNGYPCGTNGYHWRIAGYVSMPQAEAQDLINRGYYMLIRLWGEDPYNDDLLIEKTQYRYEGLRASYRGLEFDRSGYTSAMVVNEDPERPFGGDELYGGIRLLTPSRTTYTHGTTVRSGETNRVTGEFWHGDCY